MIGTSERAIEHGLGAYGAFRRLGSSHENAVEASVPWLVLAENPNASYEEQEAFVPVGSQILELVLNDEQLRETVMQDIALTHKVIDETMEGN